MGFFGFGKEEKTPFKVPKGISELRMMIEIENRERFPNLGRYQEISRVAEIVYQDLNDMISRKEHPEEAVRIKEDIRKKLDALGEKIKKNMQEAQKEEKQDYVERNIDYLERKSMRNAAKTVFTEFLDGAEAFALFAREGKLLHEKEIETVIMELFAAVAELNNNYFKRYGDDKDIQILKEKAREKLDELERIFNEQRPRFTDKKLETNVEMYLNKHRSHD